MIRRLLSWFQVTTEDCLLPWLDERIIIRGATC